jgi:DNA polymerase-1
VHTSYSLAAATTGRLASTDPNLQNIPIRTEEGRKIRKAFIAEPGHVLISADYSQIELRLLAHVGDIPQLKRAFADGLDIHAMTASEMFGTPIEGMPRHPPPRQGDQLRHRLRHQRLRPGQPAGHRPVGEAGAYIKTYFERFPGIREYMDGPRRGARERLRHHHLRAPINIPDIRGKAVRHAPVRERAAINAPLQGAAADIIRRAMARMPGRWSRPG